MLHRNQNTNSYCGNYFCCFNKFCSCSYIYSRYKSSNHSCRNNNDSSSNNNSSNIHSHDSNNSNYNNNSSNLNSHSSSNNCNSMTATTT